MLRAERIKKLVREQKYGKPTNRVTLDLDTDQDRYIPKHYDTYEDLRKKFDYVRMENLKDGHVAFVCYDYEKKFG